MIPPRRFRQLVLIVMITPVIIYGGIRLWTIWTYAGPTSDESFPYHVLVWSYQADEQIKAMATSPNGLAALLTKSRLFVLDTETGTLLWQKSLESPAFNPAPPAFYQDELYLANQNGLFKWDAGSSELLLHQSINQSFQYGFIRDISHCCIIINAFARSLLVFDRITGDRIFSLDAYRGYTYAHETGGKVFISRYGLKTYDIATHIIQIQLDTETLVAVIEGGSLYYIARRDDQRILGTFDTVDMQVKWESDAFDGDGSGIIMVGEAPLVHTLRGMTLFDPETGVQRYQIKTERATQPPVYYDGYIFILEYDKSKILAYDSNDGTLIGQLKIVQPNGSLALLTSQYSFAGDKLILFEGKNVYALGK